MNQSLRYFSKKIGKVYSFFQRRPLLIVFLTLFVAGLASSGLKKQRLLISYRDLFDSKFKSVQQYDETESLFATGNAVLLLAKPKTGEWTNELLCQYRLWILNQGLDRVDLERFRSVFSLRETSNSKNLIHYPWILNPDCSADAAKKPYDLTRLKITPWNDTLYSSKTNDLGAEFIFKDTEGGSKYGKFDPKPIGEVIQSFDQILGKNLEGVWTGPSMYDHSMHSGLKRMPYLNSLVLILLLFLYRAFLGTWRSGVMMSLTLILTGLMLYGFMAFIGAPTDILSSGLFLMLVVSAHQDFSYLSFQRMKGKGSPLLLFRRFLISGFFTSFTTMVGFASLCVSDLSVIVRFGFLAAIGAGLEWMMVFFFLPALITLVPWFQFWVREEKIWIRDPLHHRFWKCLHPSRQMSKWFLGIFFLIPLAIHFANFSEDPKNFYEKSHPFHQALDYLTDTRGWEGTMNLVFKPDLKPDFESSVIEKVKQAKLVVKTEGAREVSNHFLKSLDSDDFDLVKRELKISGLLNSYEAPSGEHRVILYVNTSDLLTIRAFEKQVSEFCPQSECYVTSPIGLYSDFIYALSRTLSESLVISLILVILIMSYLIRACGISHGFALIASSLWGPVMMLILVSIFQVPLNAYTCNFTTVLVGLAGDNAIQFIFATRQKKLGGGIHSRGGGAFFTSFVMGVCSLVFLGSYFHPPKVLGLLLFFGFLLNFYGDYSILRGLISLPVERAKF